jgi:hypothetical protein
MIGINIFKVKVNFRKLFFVSLSLSLLCTTKTKQNEIVFFYLFLEIKESYKLRQTKTTELHFFRILKFGGIFWVKKFFLFLFFVHMQILTTLLLIPITRICILQKVNFLQIYFTLGSNENSQFMKMSFSIFSMLDNYIMRQYFLGAQNTKFMLLN